MGVLINSCQQEREECSANVINVFNLVLSNRRALIGGQEPRRAGGGSSFSCLGQAWGFGSGIWPAGQPITGCEEPF